MRWGRCFRRDKRLFCVQQKFNSITKKRKIGRYDSKRKSAEKPVFMRVCGTLLNFMKHPGHSYEPKGRGFESLLACHPVDIKKIFAQKTAPRRGFLMPGSLDFEREFNRENLLKRLFMSISFERKGSELILTLAPERIYTHEILEVLNKDDKWRISHTFTVYKKHFRSEDIEQNEIKFCIGNVCDEYTLIDSDVIGTKHKFYFFNTISLDKRYFVAYRNISILSKIDQIVDQDVYIGGNHAEGYIPLETFELLIKKFPKTAELDYYAHARIATIVKEFYPKAEQHEIDFNKYMERQEKRLSSIFPKNVQTVFEENATIEFRQFKGLKHNLTELLKRADSISEHIWQEQIHGLLRLLYPKYIAGIREVVIRGVDRHDKRPDFLLVDANGYIDILEIKKPSVQLLTKQSLYRNNYVPVRDLSGAVQQIEKYIYCLNAWGKDGEQELQKKLFSKLPVTVTPKIVNPQGILIMGRSNQFNHQQKDDFELIKRQYKHISEIMTYDDLVHRIENIMAALNKSISLN